MRLRRRRWWRRKLGGGGNSTGSADVKITIPKSTSSDINILGDFQPSDADNFYYEIYYSKPDGSSQSSSQFARTGGTVTFSKVKYDTYTFYLKIWVDNRMKQVLTTDSKTVAVSESESKVEFPDRSVSEYKNWFFVSTADALRQAVTTISNDTTFSESNKAKICLRDSIAMVGYQTILASINGKYELLKNGYELEESLFSVTITEVEGGTVTADRTQASAGREVTVTVNPNENYKLKSLKMNGTALTVADGTATFSMPSENATITAEFCKIFKIKYTITVTGTNAFPASSSFTLYDCSTDALSESFNKDTPVAVAEDEITTTSLMKPSHTGYIAIVDSTDTPYIFKGWDYDGDGTADTTDTSTSAKLTDTIFAGKNAGDEVTLAAVWAEATTDADKESVWAGIPYNATYYNNHSTFQIWTDAQAANIFVDLNTYNYSGKTIELMADVSVNKGLEYLWGTFNGNNKTLTVNITTSGFNGCAPFINLNSATIIKNLTVAGTITAPANSYYVGGIAGTTSYATIENCTVTATIKGVLSSGNDYGVGGIAGKCFGTITGCTFSGTVQGYQNVGVGGIVGCCNNGTVQNNTVTGTIKYEGDSDSPPFDTSWTAGYGAIIGRSTGSSTANVSGNTVSATATVSKASGVPLIANITGYNP